MRRESQVLADLVRIISSTRQLQEEERQRRLAWEQEQEAKYAQRQADMEQKIKQMFEEVKALRSTMNTLNNPVSSSELVMSPTLSQPASTRDSVHPATPVSPMAHPVAYSQSQPVFVQGSSTTPITINQMRTLPSPPDHFPPGTMYNTQFTATQTSPLLISSVSSHHGVRNAPYTQPQLIQEHTFQVSVPPTIYAITPDPSPQLVDISDQASSQPSRPGKRTKRCPRLSSDDDESSSSFSSANIPPRKRRNNHDTRCYTIHVRRLLRLTYEV